jgi:hypothetical protein
LGVQSSSTTGEINSFRCDHSGTLGKRKKEKDPQVSLWHEDILPTKHTNKIEAASAAAAFRTALANRNFGSSNGNPVPLF